MTFEEAKKNKEYWDWYRNTQKILIEKVHDLLCDNILCKDCPIQKHCNRSAFSKMRDAPLQYLQ